MKVKFFVVTIFMVNFDVEHAKEATLIPSARGWSTETGDKNTK